ncbi:hypothetical protein [Undibacterium flavidum]|uniref:Sel1 repeat-containing protein n=1 Tax=Undibacterium flavidum TaxID=2762297 RepID=A0ABR6YG33_9BURK|nr:hypothetical protein [Undibacterium flavidum]MBC3875544.1 hypothetical protein [Undibacterium flavidum]
MKNAKLQISILILALSLIGGTGCVSYILKSSPSPEETNKRLASEKVAMQRKENEYYSDLILSAKTNPVSKTILSFAYLDPQGHFTRDLNTGLSYLKSAVDDQYPSAEYYYAKFLIYGSATPYKKFDLTEVEFQRSPEAGINLLIKSASKICLAKSLYSTQITEDARASDPNENPAAILSEIYSQGRVTKKDKTLAQLWYLRELIHCGKAYIVIKPSDPLRIVGHEELSQAETLAILLIHRKTEYRNTDSTQQRIAYFKTQLTPREIEQAYQIAETYKKLVHDSESTYPNPNTYAGIP